MLERMNMKTNRPKITIVRLVFLCLAVSIFVAGCVADYGGVVMSSRKVCVIDLESGAEYQPLLSGKPQTCGMRSGRVYLRSGETCGQHNTDDHEEMLVFLSGRGMALIDEGEDSYPVGQGKVSYIPPHTVHNIKNTGAEPLVYIYCVTPVE